MSSWLPVLFSVLFALQTALGGDVPRTGVTEQLNCQTSCPSPHGQTRGGDLTITIVEATGLPDKDGWGYAAYLTDAYVVVDVGGTVRKTETVLDTLAPLWPDGSADLNFGSKVSGTPVKFEIWDEDEGLEFDDDYIGEALSKVLDCSCFTNDYGADVTCDKPECVEEAWLPLEVGANCNGRTAWPWNADADPYAKCLRIRMKVVPFSLNVEKIFEPDRTISITTASVQDPGNPPEGEWGQPYYGNPEVIDPRGGFMGGLLLQTNILDKNRKSSGPYIRFSSNLDGEIYLFRKIDDYDSRPLWLQDTSVWSNSTYYLTKFGDDYNMDPTVRYRAMIAQIKANEPIELGYPAHGTGKDMVAMYIIIVTFTENVDQEEYAYTHTFEMDNFIPVLIEMIVVLSLFYWLLSPAMKKACWRVDRLESVILEIASRGVDRSLLSLVIEEPYNNGSKANVDFRRNMFFVTLGLKITLLTPVATFISYSLVATYSALPRSAGISLLCNGTGTLVLMWNFTTWKNGGWRMTKQRLRFFVLSFVSLFLYLLLSVITDGRVWDEIAPQSYSIFCLTSVSLTANCLPLIWIFILGDERMHEAFLQLQRVIDKNQKLMNVKNKFQALGTMGLKMALLNAAAKSPKQESKSEGNENEKRPFGVLLGSVFTLDSDIPAFCYSDIFRETFIQERAKRVIMMKKWYLISILLLLVYSGIVYAKCDEAVKYQGFGISFAVIALDGAIFLLRRGPTLWGTGQFVFLAFVGRISVCMWVGDWWIVGIGMAYCIFGYFLGSEIVDQRMQSLSNDYAGAVAYFGKPQEKRNPYDTSASPEFILGYLSGLFLVTLLAYIFLLPAEEIPAVPLGGQSWEVWIFGVAAFVIVLVSVVLKLAKRSLMLQKQGLLTSKKHFYYKSFTLPLQFTAFAELLVIMFGLFFYALTSSMVIFLTAVFFPLILGSGYAVYGQWVSNDFELLEPAFKRIEEDDEEEEEEDDDEEETDSEDDEDGESKGLLGRFKSKANNGIMDLSNITKKVENGGKITMPTLPFRKPISKARKVKVEEEEKPLVSDFENAEKKNNDGEDINQDSTEMDEKINSPDKSKFQAIRTKLLSFKEKVKAWYLEKYTKGRNRARTAIGITDETDPVKMKWVDAYWKGVLTSRDYQTLNAFAMFVLLIFVYGQLVSMINSDLKLLGNMVWVLAILLLSSLLPMRKYYGTLVLSRGVIASFFVAGLVEILTVLFVFVYLIGGSISDTSVIWMLLMLFGWPAFLATVVLVMVWAESGYKTNKISEIYLPRIGKFFAFYCFCFWVWSGQKLGAISLLIWLVLYGMFTLIKAWARNERYLPRRYKNAVRFLMSSSAAALFALSTMVKSDTDSFFCVSLAFACIGIIILQQLMVVYASVPDGMPIYFSTFIFPIFSLNPESNDLIDLNELGYAIFSGILTLFCWGMFTVIMINPLEFGIGIMSLSLLLGVSLTAYFVTRTPVWMADSTLCVDEKEIKVNAALARNNFQLRRENLQVQCEEYEIRDKEEAAMQRKLNRFSKFNNSKAKQIKYAKRYTAVEMENALSAAEKRLAFDRLGAPRKDRPFTVSDVIRDSWYLGKGPLAAFSLGGLPFSLYDTYRNPSKKKKHKVYALGINAGDEADQLDRLIEVLGAGGDLLSIEIKDYDLTSLDDSLGKVEIALDEIVPDKYKKKWLELEDVKVKSNGEQQATGKLQVGIEVKNIWGDLQVRVDIIRAKGLRAADSGGTSDPYCILRCGNYTRRTPVIFKTLNPDFRKSKGKGRFVFPPVDDTIIVEVKDQDMFGTADSLGGVDIVLTDLTPNTEHVGWYQLEGGHGKTRATGEIKLSLHLSKEVTELGLVKSDCALSVNVVEARGLRAADRGGTSDPFCVCKCGLDAFKTSVIKKNLNPTWHEEYIFNEKSLSEDVDSEDEDETENIELLDCWKVYLQLPKLDLALSKEYYEECRACTLFQLQLVVSSKGRIDKEAILFQRFLREYRFKLLANGIEPPKTIFRSKSWATVDVTVVAIWLLRLSEEQRERFYQLKEKFSSEVDSVDQRRMEQDRQLKAHAQTLKSWQENYDYQVMLRVNEMYVQRRYARQEKGIDLDPQNIEPEEVVNAREMLNEIESGKDCYPSPTGDGIVFVDPDFPADSTVISSIAQASLVTNWKRANAFNMNADLFSGGTDPDDVFQGIIHNGWFLSAISILAASGSIGDDDVDPLIDNLFISKERSQVGAYAVRLYKNSRWEAIIVDDQFPAVDNSAIVGQIRNPGVACSYSTNFEEIWVSVLEKAYAKYYGGYTLLENGYVHHALTSLTGAFSEEIHLLSESQGSSKLRLWKRLLRYSRNGFLMGCGTISNDSANSEQLDSGLVFGACYAIYQVVDIGRSKLIQLRNPPGDHGEWSGDWSDQSECWTRRLKVKLEWADVDDGTFWMSFDDFLLSFRSLYVCHYYNPEKWLQEKVSGSWDVELKTAGGLPCKHNPECKLENNPQWVIDCDHPVDIHIKVSQTELKQTEKPQPFTIFLIECQNDTGKGIPDRIERLDRNSIVDWSGNPDRSLEKHVYATLGANRYILLISTYVSGQEGKFEVNLDASSKGVQFEQLWPVKPDDSVVQRPKTKLGKFAEKMFSPFHQKVTAKIDTAKKQFHEKVGPIDAIELKATNDNNLEDVAHTIDVGETIKDAGVEKEAIVAKRKSAQATEKKGKEKEKEKGPEIKEETSASWAKQYDPNSGRYYYYNTETRVSQWEEPPDFVEGGKSEELDAATKIQSRFRGKKSRRELLNKNASLSTSNTDEKEKESNWVKQYDPNSGRNYYYNTKTGVSQWEEPIGFIEGKKSEELEAATKIQSRFRGNKSRRELEIKEKPNDAKDWVKQYDPNSGHYYYYNTQTGVSQWNEPPGFMEGQRSDELDAATKIQSRFRGNKSRRNMLEN